MKLPLALGLALGVATAGCTTGVDVPPADLVLLGGKLETLDPSRPDASALAASGGRIVAVGSDDEIRRRVGPSTRVIDLEGRLAVPGFIESHGHFSGLGRSLMNVDVSGEPTWDAVVDAIRSAAESVPTGEWILGWGWHQEKWIAPAQPSVEGYPTHERLSRAVPDHPVLLKHAAGNHAGLVNAAAMRRAGIGRDTPDPSGGKILRDAAGRPTGVLREKAYALALDAYERDMQSRTSEETAASALRELELAARECLANGITTFHDAGADFATVDRMREMAEAGRLGVRLWVMLNEDNDALRARIADYRLVGTAEQRLTVRAIKRSVDGALGSHGAWLLEPYADLTDTHGLNTYSVQELRDTAAIALDNGFQLCVHAIGDRANREALDVFERAFESRPDAGDLRWRIEHAQHLDVDDIPRFATLGVVASMQGVHCTSDAPWVPVRLGDRRSERGAYVWRKLLDSGAVVVNGTDTPIEKIDPIANFEASVTRRTADGSVFYPEQRMTRIEALRSYTIDAAYAAFEEDSKGSLTPGKLADVTVLSEDIMTIPEPRIRDARVDYTIVGGRVLYDRAADRLASHPGGGE